MDSRYDVLTAVLVSFFLGFGLTTVSYAQNKCSSVHKGVFRLKNQQNGETIIRRTNRYQFETNKKLGYRSRSDVKWIDSCTYELSNEKLLKGASHLAGKPTDVFRVRIQNVSSKSMIVVTSSNFSLMTVRREIEILK